MPTRRRTTVVAALTAVVLGWPSPALASDDVRPVRFGSTVYRQGDESYRQAYQRVTEDFGQLGAIRLFFPDLPRSWETIRRDFGDSRMLVSFKAAPTAVVNGRYDQQLRTWFAQAPRDRTTRWSFWHEPEDDIAAGRFTARTYRRAWAHIDSLAAAARNPRLRSTLVLMCWTLEPASHRDWRSYYAGGRIIDQLGFDCYNAGHSAGRYRAPDDLFRNVQALARRLGKPWGVAELGSVIAQGDDGSARARWLRQVAAYLRSKDARFCTYFNSDVGVDFQLHDAASRRAWRAVVRRQ